MLNPSAKENMYSEREHSLLKHVFLQKTLQNQVLIPWMIWVINKMMFSLNLFYFIYIRKVIFVIY